MKPQVLLLPWGRVAPLDTRGWCVLRRRPSCAELEPLSHRVINPLIPQPRKLEVGEVADALLRRAGYFG